jgi:hypothetical protein
MSSPSSCNFLPASRWLSPSTVRWKWHVPLKHLMSFNRLHSIVSHKIKLFTVVGCMHLSFNQDHILWINSSNVSMEDNTIKCIDWHLLYSMHTNTNGCREKGRETHNCGPNKAIQLLVRGWILVTSWHYNCGVLCNVGFAFWWRPIVAKLCKGLLNIKLFHWLTLMLINSWWLWFISRYSLLAHP